MKMAWWDWVIAGAIDAQVTARGFAQGFANYFDTSAQVSGILASQERRKQEWELQYSLAQKDEAIGEQQITQAMDRQRIVGQERVIAQMQANHAQATVEFLANKFTNADLYEWMSGILVRVYSYFLQQATALARLAQGQLAFERQEKPLALIRTDYWQATADDAASGNAQAQNRGRRGLTGSARLLQDIYQLDQYAFDTNKRKLQLSKTLSLSQLAPIEFQSFRETGRLIFATPTALFDRDFPGQYLRLIKRVRTSVAALIPPNQGIRATLTNSGISRATIADGGFRQVVIKRDPELVALTSPMNATGLFELDTQSDLLLPFEGIGVDTTWMFDMPRASNPFDYRTVADVLLTIEYTALHSFDYRQQVIQRLDNTVSSDRAFSLREQFPDAWYDLNNPDQAATPMKITFQTTAADFPPNVERLTIQQLVLYPVFAGGQPQDLHNITLQLTTQQQQTKVPAAPGAATLVNGVVSTRSGSGSEWKGLIKAEPFGKWELQFATDTDTQKVFKDGKVEDILFVITYGGRTPPWPS